MIKLKFLKFKMNRNNFKKKIHSTIPKISTNIYIWMIWGHWKIQMSGFKVRGTHFNQAMAKKFRVKGSSLTEHLLRKEISQTEIQNPQLITITDFPIWMTSHRQKG